jgi:hypothetical protein
MSKPNDDPNTKGKGASILERLKSLFEEDDANAGQSDGSDTSADDNKKKEGKDETTDATTAADDTKSKTVEGTKKTDSDDTEDKVLSADEINKIVKERLQRQRTKMSGDFEKQKSTFENTIVSLSTELEGYRNAEKAEVKAEFDALPDEVKTFAPVADLDSAENVAKIKEWLPKAKPIAEKFKAGDNTNKSKDKKDVAAGNGNDPDKKSVTGGNDEDDVIDRRKRHSIYRSF